MPLVKGTKVGPYEIAEPLGAGGMGEVYRARDTALDRDVAIKVLPDLFADDPERLARFEREAKTLASLNHPNIAHIHGIVGAATGSVRSRALVMELVEGETLAEVIAARAVPSRPAAADRPSSGLPVEECLAIAKQIAEALEAAHEQGIIHRDLKPANIKITADGAVKVLDFGLAKAIEPATGPSSSSALLNSPTITSPAAMTRLGVILGTAAYMSPEQAKGKPVDRRSDIWAFGCVVYEMLTGRRAFEGDDVTDTIAFVITRQPDWTALPVDTPPAIRRLLRRCLHKDRRHRLAHIADARLELEDAAVDESAPVAPTGPARRSGRLAWILLAVVCAVAVALGATFYVRMPAPDTRVFRSLIVPPVNLVGAPGLRLALSPDGRHLAFIARGVGGRPMLWVRPLDSASAQPLAGTEDAGAPFWSPDSRHLAFNAGGKLKKIRVSGGPVLTLCDAELMPPGSWSQHDVILFTPRPGSPLFSVPAAGGTPMPATALDPDHGEITHVFPEFLPDGRHFLFNAVGAGAATGAIHLASLDSPVRTRLIDTGSNVAYAQGHLLFVRNATLMAQPFDPERRTLTGEALPVVEQLLMNTSFSHAATFAVSDNGLLVYQTGAGASELHWVDRSGADLGRLGEQATYTELKLSPDGRHVAAAVAASGGVPHIWILDVKRDLRTRLTFEASGSTMPIWSPDGSRITYASRRGPFYDLHQKPSSGTAAEERLLVDDRQKAPLSWSPDGRFLLFTVAITPFRGTLWVLPLDGDGEPFQYLDTVVTRGVGEFSPDGRWVVYQSVESGRDEIYVSPFPGPGGRWQVSPAGGIAPRWRRDGREVFFLAGDKMMAAEVTLSASGVDVGSVRPLFDFNVGGDGWGFYDVSADGQRLLINKRDTDAVTPITLVVNWLAALREP